MTEKNFGIDNGDSYYCGIPEEQPFTRKTLLFLLSRIIATFVIIWLASGDIQKELPVICK